MHPQRRRRAAGAAGGSELPNLRTCSPPAATHLTGPTENTKKYFASGCSPPTITCKRCGRGSQAKARGLLARLCLEVGWRQRQPVRAAWHAQQTANLLHPLLSTNPTLTVKSLAALAATVPVACTARKSRRVDTAHVTGRMISAVPATRGVTLHASGCVEAVRHARLGDMLCYGQLAKREGRRAGGTAGAAPQLPAGACGSGGAAAAALGRAAPNAQPCRLGPTGSR